jgi:hypothetical protein
MGAGSATVFGARPIPITEIGALVCDDCTAAWLGTARAFNAKPIDIAAVIVAFAGEQGYWLICAANCELDRMLTIPVDYRLTGCIEGAIIREEVFLKLLEEKLVNTGLVAAWTHARQ